MEIINDLEPGFQSEIDVRKGKLEKMKSFGEIPYKDKYEKSHSLKEVSSLPEGTNVSICGRVITKRTFGKFMFMKIYDIEHTQQISLSVNEVGDENYKYITSMIDIADFIGAKGTLYYTKTGELTVKVCDFTLLSKTLKPLPEKWHGLENVDLRYQKRYLDLISNEEVRTTFLTRTRIINYIRGFLIEHSFFEIETPILQSVASGAMAKPFTTKHNALNIELFLRIAPELYLKQAIAGGFDRVFEIGKNFRNEGMDASHLQEFTMLEWYAAYWDYQDNIKFSVELIKNLVLAVCGSHLVEYDGNILDFSKEFAKIDYTEEINRLIQSDILKYDDLNELKARITMYELLSDSELEKVNSIPSAIDSLYKKRIRPFLTQPTILYHYPRCLIPLARINDENSKIIDMFQLVICGWEIMKAYSELVDPMEQANNFTQQAKNKFGGDEEAMSIDESFIVAMEHGMPPMSGLGLGIDRLVAILCNQTTLRDVILFPMVK